MCDVSFSSASSLVTTAIIQEGRPFPDEFHSWLNDTAFESNVTGPDLEGEGEGDVKATPWTPLGNNNKQEHLSSGHVSLLAQHFFNDTVIPSSLSQEMTPQVIRRHSLATMDVTSHELPPSDVHVPNRFSRAYSAQDDPFAPSYVLARQRANLYKYASISSARRMSEPVVRASCNLEDIKPKSKPLKETTLEPFSPVKTKEEHLSLTASLGITPFDDVKSGNFPCIDSEKRHGLPSNVYKL